MAQLVGVFLELVVEQRTVERQLYKMLLLWYRSVGIVFGRRERHKLSLARLLFYYRCATVLIVQQVETALNAEYVAEEGRLQYHRLRVVLVHLLGQVVANELLYILFLRACVLIEFLYRSLVVHVVARSQTYGVGLEEFHNALAERHVTVVYRVVQEASSKITEMDVHRVGLRFQSVHHVHIWRLGVGFEARCNSRDVYQIVGFVNDEFGHAHILLHANAHEVELCVCRKYLFQISPVAFAAQRQITVLPSVANLKFRSVLFFRGVNVVVVPRTYDAAQQVYVEFAPTSLAVLLGQQPVERLRY